MALLSPTTLLTPLFLLAISLPLALLATLTTSLAFALLALRVSLIYIDLAVAILHSWLLPSPTPPTMTEKKPPPRKLSHYAAASARRRRKSSLFPYSTAGTAAHLEGVSKGAWPEGGANVAGRASVAVGTPIGAGGIYGNGAAGGMNRDYEGLGGWRISEESGDDDLRMGLSKRLVLPLPPPGYGSSITSPLSAGGAGGRDFPSRTGPNDGATSQARGDQPRSPMRDHPRRSLSNGTPPRPPSPEQLRMSPVERRPSSPPRLDRNPPTSAPSQDGQTTPINLHPHTQAASVRFHPQHGSPGTTPFRDDQGRVPTSYFDVRSENQVRLMSVEEAASEQRLRERRLSFSGSSGSSAVSTRLKLRGVGEG